MPGTVVVPLGPFVSTNKNSKYVLILIEVETGWIFVCPLLNNDPSGWARAIFHKIYTIFPSLSQSYFLYETENSKITKLSQKLENFLGTNHDFRIYSLPHTTETYSAHAELYKALQYFTNDIVANHPSDWDEALDNIAAHYNTQVFLPRSHTPFENVWHENALTQHNVPEEVIKKSKMLFETILILHGLSTFEEAKIFYEHDMSDNLPEIVA